MSAPGGFPEGAAALGAALAAGMLSSEQATRIYLERIAARDGAIRSFVHVAAESALAAARASDTRRARGAAHGPLDGVPIAVKDNIDVRAMPCAGGIGHYRHRVPADDARVIERLRAAGTVILGKLNMHEGALGATNDNPWFGRCQNPAAPGRTPGGSSGGSGAAVAAGFCAAALGTDTMGSVRVPAAYCGVTGFKPGLGAISTRGVMPLSWTLDHVGVLGSTVADVRLVAGIAMEAGLAPARPPDPHRIAFGVFNLEGVALEPAVAQAFADLVARVRAAGARVVELDTTGIQWTRFRLDGLLISEIEGAAFHGDAIAADPQGFSQGFRDMLAYGAKQGAVRTALAYRRVAEAGALIRSRMAGVDAVLLPTTPQVAFPFDAPVPANQADLTALANFSGGAACAGPMRPAPGATLPVSWQVMGLPGADDAVLDHSEFLRPLG